MQRLFLSIATPPGHQHVLPACCSFNSDPYRPILYVYVHKYSCIDLSNTVKIKLSRIVVRLLLVWSLLGNEKQIISDGMKETIIQAADGTGLFP